MAQEARCIIAGRARRAWKIPIVRAICWPRERDMTVIVAARV